MIPATPARCRRLACSGFVDAASESQIAGNYLLLRELTRRGISVDLFADRGRVPPPPGLPLESFRYLGFAPPLLQRLLDRPPERVSWVLGRMCLPAVYASWQRTYQPAAESSHAAAPYDALLVLATTARPFTLSGVPTVTQPQGGLASEQEAIRRLRRQIVAARGWPFYLALVAAYRYGDLVQRRVLRSSERIVVGSDWSRETYIAGGFDPTRVHAVSYAVDLELFRPGEGRPTVKSTGPLIVAVGRLDPRKRLDLLLEAFRLVLRGRPDATLRIVGQPGYTPKHLSSIERFSPRDRVRYEPQIPREQVPRVLQGATVLVQTSENENWGASVAEALACGTPVVVGPSNGTAQYVDPTSQIFASYTPEAVASATLKAIRTRERHPEDVRKSTRAAAEKWFSPPAVADRTIEILEEAIREARGVGPAPTRAR